MGAVEERSDRWEGKMELRIGYHIRRLRRLRGMTQRQMAERLRISTQAVSKWERGLGYPDVAMLVPIADLLCVSLDELFGRKHVEQ